MSRRFFSHFYGFLRPDDPAFFAAEAGFFSNQAELCLLQGTQQPSEAMTIAPPSPRFFFARSPQQIFSPLQGKCDPSF